MKKDGQDQGILGINFVIYDNRQGILSCFGQFKVDSFKII